MFLKRSHLCQGGEFCEDRGDLKIAGETPVRDTVPLSRVSWGRVSPLLSRKERYRESFNEEIGIFHCTGSERVQR